MRNFPCPLITYSIFSWAGKASQRRPPAKLMVQRRHWRPPGAIPAHLDTDIQLVPKSAQHRRLEPQAAHRRVASPMLTQGHQYLTLGPFQRPFQRFVLSVGPDRKHAQNEANESARRLPNFGRPELRPSLGAQGVTFRCVCVLACRFCGGWRSLSPEPFQRIGREPRECQPHRQTSEPRTHGFPTRSRP